MSCPNLNFNTNCALLKLNLTSDAVCRTLTTQTECEGGGKGSLLFAKEKKGTITGYDPCQWNDKEEACYLPLGGPNDLCHALGGKPHPDDPDLCVGWPNSACWEKCANHVGFVDENLKSCYTAAGAQATLNTSDTCMRRFNPWYSRCLDPAEGNLCVEGGDTKTCEKECHARVNKDNPLENKPYCVDTYCKQTCNTLYR
jgi:hypothetical protein